MTLTPSQSNRSPDTIDHALGRSVRHYRSLCGMTQEELATALGITFQQVQKYERGQNRIAVSRLMEIAAVLEVSVYDLLTPDPHLPHLHTRERTTLTMARAFTRIESRTIREALIHLAKALEEVPHPTNPEPTDKAVST